MRQCWINNPDGAGFAFAHDGNVFIKKGFMTWDAFIDSFNYWNKRIDFKNKGMLIHFRIATHGGTNRSMTHPFPIETDEGALSKPEYITNYAVIHNGIISLTSSKASKSQGLSDTAIFIRDYLSLIAKNKKWFNNPHNIQLIEKLIDSKMAILDRFGNIKMTSGFDADNGVYYSNKTYQDNYFRKSNKATYWNNVYSGYDYDDEDYYEYYYNYYKDKEDEKGKSSVKTTKYNTSTGHYDTVRHIPLMKARIGDTIEYDAGSIAVTRREDCLYYISEDGMVFYRYPTVSGGEYCGEYHSLYEFIGMGTIYDSNIKEVPFKATCWVSEDNFLDSSCEDVSLSDEDEDVIKALAEKAKELEKEEEKSEKPLDK